MTMIAERQSTANGRTRTIGRPTGCFGRPRAPRHGAAGNDYPKRAPSADGRSSRRPSARLLFKKTRPHQKLFEERTCSLRRTPCAGVQDGCPTTCKRREQASRDPRVILRTDGDSKLNDESEHLLCVDIQTELSSKMNILF